MKEQMRYPCEVRPEEHGRQAVKLVIKDDTHNSTKQGFLNRKALF
jgi:hypothetical protein